MYKIKLKFTLTCLALISCWLYFIGCAASPAPITDKSGDSDFAQLFETIRKEENLPALAASIIIDGGIYATAAVGTRKVGTDNWVTIDDKFLIGSCGKAFTATLAAILIDEGLIHWKSSVRESLFRKIFQTILHQWVMLQLVSAIGPDLSFFT